MPTRTPGAYGCRPYVERPSIKFGDIYTGATIPPHPTSTDHLARLGNWQMLGNDNAGDCVAVTWANYRRLITAFLTTENYPTQQQVWDLYKTQNPDFDPNGTVTTNGPGSNADNGMDIQVLLNYLVAHGGPDGVKPVAFATVDHNNEAELSAAIAIFGGTWDAMLVSVANEKQFSGNQPWDYVPGSPYVGGHSVLSGGYNPGDDTFITWAEETQFTSAFRTHQVVQSFVVVWPENLGTPQFEAGIDRSALATAYQELTGRRLILLPPTLAPNPTDATFAAQLRAFTSAAQVWLTSRNL